MKPQVDPFKLKQLRIIIIALILVTAGTFIYITAGSDPETLLFERIMVTDQRTVLMILLICAFTILSTLTGLPIFYLSMGMGFLLHFTPALLICWIVNILAVMATFYMVRFTFTSYFQERYGEKKLIRGMNSRIQKYGMWSVVFSRSIYIIPTNMINFSFPLSRIPARSYFLGTLFGLIPECMLNVLTGYLIKHEVILLTSPGERTWQVLLVGGFILAFALLFIFLRIRHRKRKQYKAFEAIPDEN